MKVAPIIKRPGGKTRLLTHLLPLVQARPHTCFVEVFAGGAALLAAKERSQVEVLNDFDGDLANCYLQIMHHPDEVLRMIPMINSRRLFHRFKSNAHMTDVQRAALYIYRNALSFGADGASWGVQRQAGGGASTSRGFVARKLAAFSARLDRVNVENLDWARCIALYDSPGTLFYCDPPYTTGGQKAYACFSREKVAALAAQLKGVKGQWVLTLDSTPANLALFNGNVIHKLSTTASTRRSSSRFAEFIAASHTR